MKTGTLYGIGVGPGDPELLTIKAARLVGTVDRVYAAASSKNTYSVSYGIVRPHLKADLGVTTLSFPMTRDAEELHRAWTANAETVLADLRQGLDAAFLTLGDPMTYSTFGYLRRRLLELDSEARVEVVPGITSFAAAAARAGFILAEAEQGVAVVSGANGGEHLRRAAEWAHTVVVMKAYKKFDHIRETLKDLGLEDKAVLVSECGRKGESVATDVALVKGRPPYFSLLLVRTKA